MVSTYNYLFKKQCNQQNLYDCAALKVKTKNNLHSLKQET